MTLRPWLRKNDIAAGISINQLETWLLSSANLFQELFPFDQKNIYISRAVVKIMALS